MPTVHWHGKHSGFKRAALGPTGALGSYKAQALNLLRQFGSRHIACQKRSAENEQSGELQELEVVLIQTQMAQTLMLRAEVCACALRPSQNVKIAEVWVGTRCA
jgi:hypothetical protein